MSIVQRGEGDTIGMGSGSPRATVIGRSLCKCLAGCILLCDRGGTTSHMRFFARP
jgi:hypothetical protein